MNKLPKLWYVLYLLLCAMWVYIISGECVHVNVNDPLCLFCLLSGGWIWIKQIFNFTISQNTNIILLPSSNKILVSVWVVKHCNFLENRYVVNILYNNLLFYHHKVEILCFLLKNSSYFKSNWKFYCFSFSSITVDEILTSTDHEIKVFIKYLFWHVNNI